MNATDKRIVLSLARRAHEGGLFKGPHREEALHILAHFEEQTANGDQRESLESFTRRSALAFESDMQPVCNALVAALQTNDIAALKGLRAMLPHLLKQVNTSPELSDLLAHQLGKTLLEGFEEERQSIANLLPRTANRDGWVTIDDHPVFLGDRAYIATRDGKKEDIRRTPEGAAIADFPILKPLLKQKDENGREFGLHIMERGPSVDLHLAHLSKAPKVVARLKQAKARILLSERGVGDTPGYEHLRGQRPRGWKSGTWGKVAGLYDTSRGVVVAGKGRHGSASLVLHEAAHALGHRAGYDNHPEVVAAHNEFYDRTNNSLGKAVFGYQRQGGRGGSAGRQEFFAEALAHTVMDKKQATKNFGESIVHFFEKEFDL
jgi:hypothetical protein